MPTNEQKQKLNQKSIDLELAIRWNCLLVVLPGDATQTSETHPANEFESVRHTKSLAKLARF